MVARAIEAQRGLGLRPRAVEQQREAIREGVKKTLQARITLVLDAFTRQLGHVDGQRALRADQAKDALHDAGPAVGRVLKRVQRGGRKSQLGRLRNAYRLVGRTHRLAEARQLRMAGLDLAQRTVEIKAVGLARERLQPLPVVGRGRFVRKASLRRFHSTGRAPRAGLKRWISPRVRDTSEVSTKLFSEAWRDRY